MKLLARLYPGAPSWQVFAFDSNLHHFMSDDDWDTDPDFVNDLTESEKRAYGNRETMEKHQAATGGHGAAFGVESGALSAPAPPPPKMGEVLRGEIGGGPTPAPAAQYTAPTRVQYAQPQIPPKAPSLVKERLPPPLPASSSSIAAASSAKPATSSAVPAHRPSKGSVFHRPKNLSDAEEQELRAVFSAFDTDQSGRISVEELSNAMQQMQLPVERGKLVALMGEADTNGDQHIDFGEFLTVVERTKAGDSSVKGRATQGLNPGLAQHTPDSRPASHTREACLGQAWAMRSGRSRPCCRSGRTRPSTPSRRRSAWPSPTSSTPSWAPSRSSPTCCPSGRSASSSVSSPTAFSSAS